MKAEDLGSVVTHHKALQFLLVHWEVTGLDVEISTAGETQHVLTLRVPRHAVGIGLLQYQGNTGTAVRAGRRSEVMHRLRLMQAHQDLEEQLLGVNVVHEAGVVFVHYSEFAARRAHVQTAH